MRVLETIKASNFSQRLLAILFGAHFLLYLSFVFVVVSDAYNPLLRAMLFSIFVAQLVLVATWQFYGTTPTFKRHLVAGFGYAVLFLPIVYPIHKANGTNPYFMLTLSRMWWNFLIPWVSLLLIFFLLRKWGFRIIKQRDQAEPRKMVNKGWFSLQDLFLLTLLVSIVALEATWIRGYVDWENFKLDSQAVRWILSNYAGVHCFPLNLIGCLCYVLLVFRPSLSHKDYPKGLDAFLILFGLIVFTGLTAPVAWSQSTRLPSDPRELLRALIYVVTLWSIILCSLRMVHWAGYRLVKT